VIISSDEEEESERDELEDDDEDVAHGAPLRCALPCTLRPIYIKR